MPGRVKRARTRKRAKTRPSAPPAGSTPVAPGVSERSARISRWSISTAQQIAQCAAKVYLRVIEGLPDPPGPAAARGDAVHNQLERYVLDQLSERDAFFPPAFRSWRSAIDARLAAEGCMPEMKIGVDAGIARITSWEEGPCRAKLDLTTILDDDTIEVVDYKTGRVYADKHREQLEFYGVLAFLKYDWVQTVVVDAWYLDEPGLTLGARKLGRHEYEEQLLSYWRKRVAADLARQEWPAQRNEFCKWCVYNSRKGGPCVEGA